MQNQIKQKRKKEEKYEKNENLGKHWYTRERERERELHSRKVGFICDAKTNCKGQKKSSKKLAKIEYIIKKWVDYGKQEKARNSLPFYIL